MYISGVGKCVNPQVGSTSTYTTPDVLFSSDTVYSIILSVTCQDNRVLMSIII